MILTLRHKQELCKVTKFITFSYTIRNIYPDKKSAKEQKANMFIFSKRIFFPIRVTISLLSSTSYLFLIYKDIIDNIKMPYLLQKEKNGYIKVYIFFFF